ncbi:MAG: choice-of-anchor I domain-containing protein [Gammaproteobacteria bacterium]
MKIISLIFKFALVTLLSGCATEPGEFVQWRLEAVSLYFSGFDKGAEIVSVQPTTLRAVVSNYEAGEVDLLDVSDPGKLKRIALFSLGLIRGEELTSVDFHPSLDLFAAVVDAGNTRGRVEIRSTSGGCLIDRVDVGFGPDAVVFSADGRLALVANEGEDFWFDPAGREFFSAEGSISLIRFTKSGSIESHKELALADISNLEGFVVLSGGRYLQREVDWDGDGVIDDDKDFDGNGRIERKKVVLGHFEGHEVFGTETDGEKGILIPIKGYSPALLEPEYIAIAPDGVMAYVTLQEENGVAVVDLIRERVIGYYGLGVTRHETDLTYDGWVAFNQVFTGLREPDGIATFEGGRYFATADEGDTDSYAGELNSKYYGPLSGGRTVSVFDAQTGEFLGDTGNQLDEMAFAYGLYPERRSAKKGAEPEMLVTFEMDSEPWAVVGLEKAGALVLISLADPEKPRAVALGKIPGDDEKSPEGIAHFQIGADHYVLTANEMNGTVACFRIIREVGYKNNRK